MRNVRLGCSSSSSAFCQPWGLHEARGGESCASSPWRTLERWFKAFMSSAGGIGIFLGSLRFGTGNRSRQRLVAVDNLISCVPTALQHLPR